MLRLRWLELLFSIVEGCRARFSALAHGGMRARGGSVGTGGRIKTLVAYVSAQMADSCAPILQAMKAIPVACVSKQPADFRLTVHATAGDTFEWSKVLLAKAHCDGTLELLTAAWEGFLGYARHEFEGKTLRQLTGSGASAAAGLVVAILDERDMQPVDVTLRSRAGEAKGLRLYRRLDPHTGMIFILAEEVPSAPRRSASPTKAP
jgi:hypothetical protein